jgi:gamma-glutamylaminecyclotransferase
MQGTRHSFAVAQRPRGRCNNEPIDHHVKCTPCPPSSSSSAPSTQGFPNAATNRGTRWPGNFRTEAAYPLYLVGDRHVPWLLNAPGTGLPVIGEVYAVDEATLRDMDALERVGHPDGYVRHEITVVPEGVEPGSPLAVQAYLKPANTLEPQDIRVGPLAEYTLAHAALYRRREP